MDLGLEDRVFLVTGGSRGLGRATAEVLVAEGARVVISGRDSDTVARSAAELGVGKALGLAVDNADQRAAERLIAAAVAKFGRLDGALLSTGGPAAGTIATLTDQQWRAAFESVFLGVVRLARAVATHATAGGSLAFVLSSSVSAPIPGLSLSNGFRPGLAGLTKDMASEFGPRGLRVNALLPGRIDTDRVRENDARAERGGSSRRPAAAIPLGRTGRPEEFGRVAAFVLSPAASYVDGALIAVDGGSTRSL